jgi:G8 domain
MKVSINIFLLYTSLLPIIIEAASLRHRPNSTIYSHKNQYNTTIVTTRALQSNVRDFQPLLCNSNLASVTCTSWSSMFGTAGLYTNRVTIPCGMCIAIDHAGATLELRGGLEIIGKLVFPNKYRLNLSTTTIIVQGELQMTSSKPVNGVPDVTITMIGSNDALTFTPIDRNSNACNGASTCTVGKKSIIVAGGKIDGTLFVQWIVGS